MGSAGRAGTSGWDPGRSRGEIVLGQGGVDGGVREADRQTDVRAGEGERLEAAEEDVFKALGLVERGAGHRTFVLEPGAAVLADRPYRLRITKAPW